MIQRQAGSQTHTIQIQYCDSIQGGQSDQGFLIDLTSVSVILSAYAGIRSLFNPFFSPSPPLLPVNKQLHAPLGADAGGRPTPPAELESVEKRPLALVRARLQLQVERECLSVGKPLLKMEQGQSSLANDYRYACADSRGKSRRGSKSTILFLFNFVLRGTLLAMEGGLSSYQKAPGIQVTMPPPVYYTMASMCAQRVLGRTSAIAHEYDGRTWCYIHTRLNTYTCACVRSNGVPSISM